MKRLVLVAYTIDDVRHAARLLIFQIKDLAIVTALIERPWVRLMTQ